MGIDDQTKEAIESAVEDGDAKSLYELMADAGAKVFYVMASDPDILVCGDYVHFHDSGVTYYYRVDEHWGYVNGDDSGPIGNDLVVCAAELEIEGKNHLIPTSYMTLADVENDIESASGEEIEDED